MAANYTEHLHLPQWDALDPFKRSEFNEAFAAIDETCGALESAAVRMACGSYKGTGTFGKDKPNSLSFDFEPKLVIIRTPSPAGNQGVVQGMTLIRGTPYQYSDTIGFNSSFFYAEWGEKSVSWYVTSGNEGDQCNQNNVDYYYIAIG